MRVVRKHALHRVLDDALGPRREQLLLADGAQATRVHGVAEYFFSRVSPLTFTFAAFTTTTKSPAGIEGVNDGRFLPRSVAAISDAMRPSDWPSASTTCQVTSISRGLSV